MVEASSQSSAVSPGAVARGQTYADCYGSAFQRLLEVQDLPYLVATSHAIAILSMAVQRNHTSPQKGGGPTSAHSVEATLAGGVRGWNPMCPLM
eukprot:CAMPEP_0174701704 /NCGR_PEP_ID=MMETSP1094-20130205/6254_1 /TAXON_ID=156173 /ORGANISM="Chrysochromulina brevifilum, Strain UTEX LB 985" /LENGTH=93 /DNA_ID=CAMNT_0015899389 /DNA_START=144 /DNA_END=426 /DNA_ORIENTATION=-